ncbi:MAG: hypothetical protein EOP61_10600 [Sphingomonadales bacterium]|nr:MAG: hypothetical protein EOP61_10600 [Sphingomonadales bacterium]
MRRIAVVAALALFALPATASAEAWYRVGGNSKTISYVDLDSLRNIGGKIIVVTRSVYAEALSGEIFGAGIRSEYDCPNKYFRTLEYSYYTKSGSLISTEPSQTINEHKVPAAGSINEAMMDFICYRKGGTLVANPTTDAPVQFPKM